MFVRLVWQEKSEIGSPGSIPGSTTGPSRRDTNIFPAPGADMRQMTLGLFDR